MLSYFPTPYPEETLYSLGARYWRLTEDTERSLKEDLPFLRRSPHYPYNLLKFQENLPPNHTLRGEDMVETRTLWKIFSFGQTEETKNGLRESMEGDEISWRKAKVARRSRTTWLKHCPECMESQIAEFGETFWVRIHQVPSVIACPKHKTELARWEIRKGCPQCPLEIIPEKKEADAYEINHADNCWKILNGFEIPREELSTRLWATLWEKGMAKRLKARLRINQKAIVNKVTTHLSPWHLEESGVDLNGKLGNRIRAALECEHNSFQMILLVMAAGEIQVSDLASPKKLPITKFPCRNPLATCYLEETIEGVRQINRGRWAFMCPKCSFEYTLPAKDTERNQPENELRIRILKVGEQWEREFTKLWNDTEESNFGITRKCKMAYSRFIAEGRRLGLKDRSVTKLRSAKERNPEIRREKTEEFKKEWLESLKKEKESGRTQFFKNHIQAGRWLRRHDLEWLRNHQPEKLKVNR